MSAINLALSTYESSNSPCLFINHGQQSIAKPTNMARLYLQGTPPPRKSLSDEILQRDPNKHELIHIHLHDGSLHCTLSPQDSRKVVEQGYGERHRLAGVGYRASYFPPFWLPSWFYNIVGRGESNLRWSYQQRMLNKTLPSSKDKKSVNPSKSPFLIPPTYTCIYAPTNQEQVEWILRIIDSSVAWALGQVE